MHISTILCNFALENLQKIQAIMIGKSPSRIEPELFSPQLSSFIDMSHELVLLSNQIDWSYLNYLYHPMLQVVYQGRN